MGQFHVVLDSQLLRAQGIDAFAEGAGGVLDAFGVFLHLPGETLGQGHDGAPYPMAIWHEGQIFVRGTAEPGSEVT